MTSPDQAQNLMPVTFPAIGLGSLVKAAAVDDPGDLGQADFRTLIASCKADIKLDPNWPRLAKTKRCAETCG
jgi:hypothetical protein